VTCYTQSCKPCKLAYILHYLPQGDESSPRGRLGICALTLPEVLTVDSKHYRGPIWDKNNPTNVPIAPIQRRCGRCCCTRRQVPLQIAWAKIVHSVQGHNAGPTGPNQSPNDIQAIVCDLGTRNCETLNPGMSYVATSRATTIGDCGTGEVIPRKYTDSAIYFKAGTFPTRLKCLTHSHKGVEYKRVQERTAWILYLDRQQEQTSTVYDQSENGDPAMDGE
jgi:hypothetical protein